MYFLNLILCDPHPLQISKVTSLNMVNISLEEEIKVFVSKFKKLVCSTVPQQFQNHQVLGESDEI
jgi:hypothetical protein